MGGGKMPESEVLVTATPSASPSKAKVFRGHWAPGQNGGLSSSGLQLENAVEAHVVEALRLAPQSMYFAIVNPPSFVVSKVGSELSFGDYLAVAFRDSSFKVLSWQDGEALSCLVVAPVASTVDSYLEQLLQTRNELTLGVKSCDDPDDVMPPRKKTSRSLKSFESGELKAAFERLSLKEKIDLLSGESSQTRNAFVIKAVDESSNLERIVTAVMDRLARKRESLTADQAMNGLRNAPKRVKQAIARAIAPELTNRTNEMKEGVKINQIRCLADVDHAKQEFLRRLVFGERATSLEGFRNWLNQLPRKEFPDYESKREIAIAVAFWQANFVGECLRFRGVPCSVSATRSKNDNGVFRVRPSVRNGGKDDVLAWSAVFPELTI